MSHPPEDTNTSGLGERRRRREAERARQRERQPSEPLTRRELRARDEALASGALTFGPEGLVPTSEFDRIEAESLSAASAAEPVTAPSADEPLPGTRRARRAVLRADSAHEESAAPDATAPPARPAPSAASSTSASSADSRVDASPDSRPSRPQPPYSGRDAAAGQDAHPGQDPSPGQHPPLPQSVPSAASAGGPETALMTPVSRRSLRDKRAAAPPVPSMHEPEHSRSGTGRRPVVRPPASVRATRGVSASGELTAIQRAVREANTAAEGVPVVEQGEATSPTSWGSAVDIPLIGAEVGLDDPGPAAEHPAAEHPARVPPSPTFPSAPSPAVAPSSSADVSPSPSSSVEAASAPIPGDAVAPAPSAATPGMVSTEVGIDVPAALTSAPTAPSAPSDEDAPDDGTFDLKPRWESLVGPVAGSQAAEPRAVQPPQPPRRVSARGPDRDQPPPDQRPVQPAPAVDPEAELLEEEARKTPAWLFLLQMVVLVLVVAVLGVLVYLFATGDLFGENNGTLAGTVASGAAVWWSGPETAVAP